MDDDLQRFDREALLEEVVRLRAGIRRHRDASGHDLCWFHPQLWSLLPETDVANLTVPEWSQFMAGCVVYRKSLDVQAADARRTIETFRNDIDP